LVLAPAPGGGVSRTSSSNQENNFTGRKGADKNDFLEILG